METPKTIKKNSLDKGTKKNNQALLNPFVAGSRRVLHRGGSWSKTPLALALSTNLRSRTSPLREQHYRTPVSSALAIAK